MDHHLFSTGLIREKMICRILLLITLTSCVCGTFVVNVAQTSYQAEENGNIMLEWMFTTNNDSSSNSLYILCEQYTEHRAFILFNLHEGVEAPASQHERFAGRVQWDKDVLRKGRIRLHVSRLRTDDSGMYMCEVMTPDGGGTGTCRLNVTAAADEPKPQRPTVRPRPESLGWIGLYVGLGLTAAALLVVVCSAYIVHLIKSTNNNGTKYAVTGMVKESTRTNRSCPLNLQSSDSSLGT